MPARFEAYRMRDGVTPLSEDFFNAVFGDVDARIADLEDRRKDLQAVIDELAGFGLERINATLIPVMQNIDAILQDMLAKKADLQAAIDRAGSLATVDELADAITAEQQARTTAMAMAITAEQDARGLAIANAVAQPSDAAYTYDGAGRVVGIDQTIGGDPSTTTITYTGGLVHEITTTFRGRRRTETYAYDGAGRVTGSTATEEAAP